MQTNYRPELDRPMLIEDGLTAGDVERLTDRNMNDPDVESWTVRKDPMLGMNRHERRRFLAQDKQKPNPPKKQRKKKR